jgi:hypothetical protein
MNWKAYISLLGLLCIGAFGCNIHPDYTNDIHVLDSLIIDAEKVKLEIPRSLETAVDSIESQLSYIQSHYKGKMNLSLALRLSQFKTIENDLDVLDSTKTIWEKEGKTALHLLQQAMKESATHDSLGAEINEAYIKKNLAQEKAASEMWKENMEKIRSHYSDLERRYDEQEKHILLTIDSLRSVHNVQH